MVDPLLRVKDLVRRFGGITATDRVSLDVAEGELHAIIGPNGAGKTTLISQLTGHLTPHSGSIFLGGRDITHLTAWRRRRMTATPSTSGATPARWLTCGRRHRMHWTGSACGTAPTSWSPV